MAHLLVEVVDAYPDFQSVLYEPIALSAVAVL
jgi:hypothetical protein